MLSSGECRSQGDFSQDTFGIAWTCVDTENAAPVSSSVASPVFSDCEYFLAQIIHSSCTRRLFRTQSCLCLISIASDTGGQQRQGRQDSSLTELSLHCLLVPTLFRDETTTSTTASRPLRSSSKQQARTSLLEKECHTKQKRRASWRRHVFLIRTAPRPHRKSFASTVVISHLAGKMMPRTGKQSMSELKLRRLTEHNLRLKEDLDRPRVRISEAAQS